jgi:hypothetical protein
MQVRPGQIGCAAILLLGATFLAWAVVEIVPRSRYGYTARRINDKICALADRRPANVDANRWEDSVAWASIASCNILFSEDHTPYESMAQFETDLDAKLKEDVDIDTLKWIGERLAKTGPTGARYFPKVRWWEQWETIQSGGN